MGLRDDLLGAWRLVSFEQTDRASGARTFPLGQGASGCILYTADGYMAAQLMRADGDAPDAPGIDPAAAGAPFGDHLAYSGAFDVDEAAGTVAHHVVVCTVRPWIGGVQERHAAFVDGRLQLRADVGDPDSPSTATLLWRRP